jgi:hypothetical protein
MFTGGGEEKIGGGFSSGGYKTGGLITVVKFEIPS